MAVANNPYPRDTRVRLEAESLSAGGFEVTVAAPRAEGEAPTEVVNGVKVIRYRMPNFGVGVGSYVLEFAYVTLTTFIACMKEWFHFGVDVIHLHNPPDSLVLAAVLPRLFGKKVVFDHHDLAPELYQTKFDGGRAGSRLVVGSLRFLEWLSCRLAHQVIVVNDSYKRIDIERNGVSESAVTIVRNGPPLGQLERVDPDPDLLARASFIIGYLGNIAKQDGVDHLLKALHQLQSSFGFDDWFAVIIGPIEEPSGLTELATELGISSKIWFAGYRPVEEWRRLLATVDVACVPDPSNPLNDKSTMVKMMEYMALGKPVVAYDLPENRATGGSAALYARASDPHSFAAELNLLRNNPQVAHDLGDAAKERVRSGLAWEFSEVKLLGLYENLERSLRN